MSAPSIDEQINDVLSPVSKAFYDFVFTDVRLFGADVPLVVLWLVAGAIALTVYFRVVNVRGLPLAVRTLRGDFDEDDAPGRSPTFRPWPPPSPAPWASETSAGWPSPSRQAAPEPRSG